MKVFIIDDQKARRTALKRLIDQIDRVEVKAASQTYSGNEPFCQDQCDACNNNNVEFHTKNNSYHCALEKINILFIHTSNKCFYRFIQTTFNDYPENDCYVVCYSGGNIPEIFNTIVEKNNGRHIKFFPNIGYNITDDTLKTKWYLEVFIDAVRSEKNNPFDYLVRKGTPYLIALAILCQGYIAAHGGEGLSGLTDQLKKKAAEKWPKVEQGWWVPVLGGDGNGNELKNALVVAGKSEDEANKLIMNVKINQDINAVYKTVSGILGGKS